MTSTLTIREHMEVVASCGKRVGIVDAVEGDSIKLTKMTRPRAASTISSR